MQRVETEQFARTTHFVADGNPIVDEDDAEAGIPGQLVERRRHPSPCRIAHPAQARRGRVDQALHERADRTGVGRQIAVETDPVERTRLANEVDKLLWDFVHTLPLYQRPELVGQREDLANFGAFGFSSTIYEDIGYMS